MKDEGYIYIMVFEKDKDGNDRRNFYYIGSTTRDVDLRNRGHKSEKGCEGEEKFKMYVYNLKYVEDTSQEKLSNTFTKNAWVPTNLPHDVKTRLADELKVDITRDTIDIIIQTIKNIYIKKLEDELNSINDKYNKIKSIVEETNSDTHKERVKTPSKPRSKEGKEIQKPAPHMWHKLSDCYNGDTPKYSWANVGNISLRYKTADDEITIPTGSFGAVAIDFIKNNTNVEELSYNIDINVGNEQNIKRIKHVAENKKMMDSVEIKHTKE